jgi:hypothetical protein
VSRVDEGQLPVDTSKPEHGPYEVMQGIPPRLGCGSRYTCGGSRAGRCAACRTRAQG